MRSQLTPQQFAFYPVRPGNGPEKPIEFPGYITSWAYGSSPGWDTVYDMGRADPKVMYKNSSRTLSLTFKVISLNETEHDINKDISNYGKLKQLGNLTLPIYGSGTSGYNGMFVKYIVGSFLAGYGYISSLDMSGGEDGPYISARPVIIDVAMSIVVLTDEIGEVPSWKNGKYSYFGVK